MSKPECGCINVTSKRIAELEEANSRTIDKLHTVTTKLITAEARIAELEAESAGRMGHIKKLVALCYAHDIPMNAVLEQALEEMLK